MSRITEVLETIIEDMDKDVKDFDRKPFDGKTLGELHGNLCATIQALAKILKKHIEEGKPQKLPKQNEEFIAGWNGAVQLLRSGREPDYIDLDNVYKITGRKP